MLPDIRELVFEAGRRGAIQRSKKVRQRRFKSLAVGKRPATSPRAPNRRNEILFSLSSYSRSVSKNPERRIWIKRQSRPAEMGVLSRLSLHQVQAVDTGDEFAVPCRCLHAVQEGSMARSQNTSKTGRRGFLKGAAAGAAALVAKPPLADAQQPAASQQAQVQQAQRGIVPQPSAAQAARETNPPPHVDVYTTDRPGSDFMADVIKSLGFEYVAANPGSSFRGLHESLINYGANKYPELLTCCHEESSVAMAHGYFKIEGKPMMIMAHGTVGLQHASMAIYNAYADRVPVYVLLGNIQDETWRRSDVEWAHSVQDAASMVRDYTKWDDNPVSLSHFAESSVRAYKIAMTPPMEPVVIVADAVLQEEPVPDADRGKLRVPKLSLSTPPAGDSAAIAEAAKMLVAAENPVIVAGRAARTPAGLKSLIELAELLQAPVQDRRFRMNFPTRHALFGGGNIADADVILA